MSGQLGQPGVTSTSILGNPVLRREDDALVRGQGRYVANVPLEAALHAHFVRSTVAHGTIESIEVDDARAMPGVVAVYTVADLGLDDRPVLMGFYPAEMKRPFLARDRVRFVGEPIAVVVAESPYLAADAAEMVWADIEPLPPVLGQSAALDGENLLFPDIGHNVAFRNSVEDPIDFSGYEVVVTEDVVNSRVAAVSIEPRVVAAGIEDGRLTCWASSQGAHNFRKSVTDLLGIEDEDLRVFVQDIGGGFGAKGVTSEEEVMVVHLARKLGRAVRWTETRTENLTGHVHGRAQEQKVTIAGTRDGDIQAYRLDVLQDCGAYPRFGAFLPEFTRQMASGVYDIERVEVEYISVVTTTTPVCAYRGAGRPEATAAIERAVDLFAAEIGMDPAEVRRRNLPGPEAFPFTNGTGTVYDSGEYEMVLDAVLEASNYADLRAEQQRRRAAGDIRQLGIGICTYVEITGFGGSEYGEVSLQADGTVLAVTGSTPIGTGHHTTWAMIVADRLGVPLEAVTVFHGDTDRVPSGQLTGGSRSVQIAGSSMGDAADKLIALARDAAADMLEAAPDDLVLDRERGAFHVAGTPSASRSWAEIAGETAEPLVGHSDFVQAGATFPFGAHIAVVEVDTETGHTTVERIVAVDDAGIIINPLLAAGQIHGGLAQGIAQALLEEIRYDEDGNPQTSNLADYTAISMMEVPTYERSFTETSTPHNPLGAKGIGEAGSIGSTAAVQSAVVDALTPFGIRHLDMPLTPERIWSALQTSNA
ncbi:MAG: xanthine dehydrogenase family protein molybdopterin-binding subunit [Actinomycetia bacterium]|jgi:carbon-monoxide dehydrogenase large subunit|nr:xanthine dehydrogenase family protein molybdopterin-binding subunit [Actinomycetes bacterium]MDP6106265.1 xanthine dehydrogenase family protein molybdopterin-binding subunit [Acidimicrobiales bacterium]HJO20018.1 xanthine dehydrogenase family protein molybdopterin-binding subunit [Acidimicrobiales bacterium]|tara:strand:+ start:4046 stop:6328 length:2283 start_codon:yes stop_codon:yes gene_type:complete